MLDNITLFHDDLSQDAVAEIRRVDALACDIETSGLDWRAESIGTCQFYTPSLGALIVQFSPDSLPPLRIKRIMESPTVTKVFHHAPFDLRFMCANWHIKPQAIACTKIASKIAFPAASPENHSLKELLAEHLGITVDKGQQSSDWLANKLSCEQLTYAANDVRHLLELRDYLESEIARKGHLRLYQACLDFLPSRIELEVGGWPDVYSY
ncbi:ribonuclease D [Actinomadura sp. SCN-SB]|uniref:ribonuclease D n=1 Tax=Actinomadura sp. SCN-SB TaxID=3373092 RepID=UPI003750E7FA